MSSTNGSELNASTSRHVPVSYTITNDTPIVALDARTAFEKLTEREQLYAHYLSRASFYGGLVCLLQTSPESPGIFRLIHRMNMAQTSEELREACLAKDIPEVDFKSFLVYSSGVYANMVSFGNCSIILFERSIYPNIQSSLIFHRHLLNFISQKNQASNLRIYHNHSI